MTYQPKDKSTNQPSSNQEFASIIRQQMFLAEFSQQAWSCLDIANLMGNLVKEVAHLLEVQFVQVVTLSDDQTVWDLRATTGWPKNFDRPATIQIKHPSQLSELLPSPKNPLIMSLKINNQVTTCAIIWESRRKRDFTANEIALVQGITQHAAMAQPIGKTCHKIIKGMDHEATLSIYHRR